MSTAKRIWAVVPARSGSKGLPNKNVRMLAGKPLIGHAIQFAQNAGVFEQVLVSTDSEDYAAIAREQGGWVPFLRGESAAQDASMEEHVLADLDAKLTEHGITPPDILVWLRPTFPFRSIDDLNTALSLMEDDVDAVRLVTEGEPRLYQIDDGYLVPRFEDGGRSMIRRQEFPATYKVFHTDIFWYRNIAWGERFLGSRIKAVPVHKICAMDVDGQEDFDMIEAIMSAAGPIVGKYCQPAPASE